MDSPLSIRDTGPEKLPCPICYSRERRPLFFYNSPPKGELPLNIAESEYRRSVIHCDSCGHCSNHFSSSADALYSKAYTDAVYGNLDGLHKSFLRIQSLPVHKSDNAGRTQFVYNVTKNYFRTLEQNKQTFQLLDVGAGVGIFVHSMKNLGLNCTALDPDARNCLHIRNCLGIEAIHSSYEDFSSTIQFDLISFNKVLEHVQTPSKLLKHARDQLKPDGAIYIEVPDATKAKQKGKHREEFFSDHFHIFSMRSVRQLITKNGFKIDSAQRLQEPSGKYTIRVFAALATR